MSVQFGIWNFEGQPPAPEYIEKVSATLAPYGPDSNESYSEGGVRILYRAFHTTKESRREKQPCISPSGAVITWDGRLDNRTDLISVLRDSSTVNSTDVDIVAAAYEKWGTNCFAKLIGDWALSVWNPRERVVLLAKDHIGTKHLYYSFDDKQLTWSTILDPLVLFAGKTFEICEEYIAGWFAITFPSAHLTPYVGIRTVPPSSSLRIRRGQHAVYKYWDFDPSKRICYRTDAEYEEHFRTALATAVQRRLRSDRPVLAELSGGMDSSSIVCVADTIIGRDDAACSRLDTISWFDDSYDHLEPDSNELHWITKVEEKRGRSGFHINFRELKAKAVSSQISSRSEFEINRFAPTPLASPRQSEFFKQCAMHIVSHGHRVVLSGIGGDEPTGAGLPTPALELQDLLARGRFSMLARQLNAWAAKIRKSRLPLLWETARGFFSGRLGVPKEICPAPWLHPGFIHRNRATLGSHFSRVKLFGPLPSFQNNINRLEDLRNFVEYCALRADPLYETRYPYGDRNLLEFLYAIPRQQIVGVGRRRYLMRRALVGIVPDELLNRRLKGFVPQTTLTDDATQWPSLVELGQHLASSSAGIIDSNRFLEVLERARRNEDVPTRSLKRTVTLEFWLRHLATHRVFTNSMAPKRPHDSSTHEAQEIREPIKSKSFASYVRDCC